jgi:hypothetical protein
VANPPNGRILPGPPQDWPHLLDWEDTFDDEPDADGLTEDDHYSEIVVDRVQPVRPVQRQVGLAVPELGVPIADQEPKLPCPVSQIDQQVAGLLDDPYSIRVGGHPPRRERTGVPTSTTKKTYKRRSITVSSCWPRGRG